MSLVIILYFLLSYKTPQRKDTGQFQIDNVILTGIFQNTQTHAALWMATNVALES